MPRAEGQAKVGSQKGSVLIQGDFSGLDMSYKFWPRIPCLRAVGDHTGRSHQQSGTLIVNNQKSKVDVTTKLQTFGMMVTAEPYFAVSFPSEKVVLANTVLNDTKGLRSRR